MESAESTLNSSSKEWRSLSLNAQSISTDSGKLVIARGIRDSSNSISSICGVSEIKNTVPRVQLGLVMHDTYDNPAKSFRQIYAKLQRSQSRE
jgi:hypothetical protein